MWILWSSINTEHNDSGMSKSATCTQQIQFSLFFKRLVNYNWQLPHYSFYQKTIIITACNVCYFTIYITSVALILQLMVLMALNGSCVPLRNYSLTHALDRDAWELGKDVDLDNHSKRRFFVSGEDIPLVYWHWRRCEMFTAKDSSKHYLTTCWIFY